MAALSVDSARAGKAMGRPRSAAAAVKRARSSRFAATPPEIEQAVRAVVLGRGEGLALQVIDDGALEGGEQIERLLVAKREGV